MTTSYPSGLDSFTNPTPTDELDDEIGTRTHSEFHADTNDAIEAIQAELGTDPSGASATVKARIEAVETLADAAQTSAEVAAAVAAEAALARNADNLTSGTVADARIASTLARDSEVAATYAPLASPTFTGNVVVPDADAATEAVNRQTGDARYAALDTSVRISAKACDLISGTPSFSGVSTRQYGWLLDAAASEGVVTPLVRLPAHWTAIDIDFVFAPQSTGAGNVRWATRLTAIAAGDTISTTDSGAEVQTTGTSVEQHIIAVNEVRSAVAVDATKWLRVWAGRIGANAADTQAGDVGLLEIVLRDANA